MGVFADKAGLCLLIPNRGRAGLQFTAPFLPQIIALGTEIPVLKQQVVDRDVDLGFKMLAWGLGCSDELLRGVSFKNAKNASHLLVGLSWVG